MGNRIYIVQRLKDLPVRGGFGLTVLTFTLAHVIGSSASLQALGNEKIYFGSTYSGIGSVSPDGSDARIYDYPQTDGQPVALSPDRTKMAFVQFTQENNSDVVVANIDGSNPVNVTIDNPNNDAEPVWFLDGTKLLITSQRNGVSGVYSINADGSKGANLLLGDGEEPDWSQVQNKILSVYYNNNKAQLYTFSPDGSGARLLFSSESGSPIHNPSWSPDGQKILFSYKGSITVINANDSSKIQLTDNSGNIDPVWSPDGDSIAWTSFKQGACNGDCSMISTMKNDGTNRRDIVSLVPNNGSVRRPDWSPDSTRLVFTGYFRNSAGEPFTPRLFIVSAQGGALTQIYSQNNGSIYPKWYSLTSYTDHNPPSGSFSGSILAIRLLGQTIKGTAADDYSGVSRVMLTTDTSFLSSDPNGGLTLNCNQTRVSCTWSAATDKLTVGIKTYTFTVFDRAGNQSTVTRQYTVL